MRPIVSAGPVPWFLPSHSLSCGCNWLPAWQVLQEKANRDAEAARAEGQKDPFAPPPPPPRLEVRQQDDAAVLRPGRTLASDS